MPIVTTRAPSHYKGARRLCIQRENQCDGSIWARDREKNTGQQKSHKSVIFPLFGGEPRLDRFDPKVAWWLMSRT